MTAERYDLAVEGLPTTDGRLLKTESLIFPEGLLPVTMVKPRTESNPYGDREVIGRATDFRRDSDGMVSAAVELIDGETIPKDYSVGVDLADMSIASESPMLVISSARLLGITFTQGDGWAWPR